MQNGCMHTVTHTLARLYALLVLTIKLLEVFLSELQKANVSIHVFDSIGSSDQLILIRQLPRQVAILANQNHCANHQINSLAHYVVAVKKFNQPLCKMLRPRLPLVLGFFFYDIVPFNCRTGCLDLVSTATQQLSSPLKIIVECINVVHVQLCSKSLCEH